MIANLKID